MVLIEMKLSRNDYKQDTKRQEYLPSCDEIYFYLDFYVSDQAEKQIGFLEEHGRTLQIQQQDTLPHLCEHVEETKWAIGRALSKKATFGWK